jgi:protein O-mannosyl-transferase
VNKKSKLKKSFPTPAASVTVKNPLFPPTSEPILMHHEVVSHPRKWVWWSLLGIIFALYAPILWGGYVLDDKIVITDNQFTQQGFSGISDIFTYESFRGYFGEQKNLIEGDRYRPFSIATFALEIGLFGKNNPGLSHFINLLLYFWTGIMLFQLAKELFFTKLGSNYLDKIGLLAVLFFVTHPLHVEAVANIKGRDEICTFLATLFCLKYTFFWCKRQKPFHLPLIFLLYSLALFSKESAITFLWIIPMTAYFFTDAAPKVIWKGTLPLLAATVFYFLIRIQVIGYVLSPNNQVITDVMNNPFYGMTFLEKTATIFYTLWLYLKLHILPHPLTHDYYPYQIPILHWSNPESIFSLLLHLGLGGIALWGWRSKNIYAYCAAFYLATMSIVSNLFVSVGTFMNERFAYQASWAFCLALAYFLNQHFIQKEQKWKQTVGYIIAGIFILGFSWKTAMRVPDWKDNQVLNQSALKYSPNSARSNLFYAVDLWEKRFLPHHTTMSDAPKKVLLDSMMPYFNRSLAILPNYNSALKMLAGIASEYHKLDNNYEVLLERFYQVNRNGYEPFVITYLKYLNPRVDAANAPKLAAFYQKNILLYRDTLRQAGQMRVYDSLRLQLRLPN